MRFERLGLNERRFLNGIVRYGTRRLLPAVAVLLLAGLAACSDSDVTGESAESGVTSGEEMKTSKLKIVTDPSEMPMEVVNYGSNARAYAWGGARAIDDVEDFEMNPYPEMPEKTTEYQTGWPWSNTRPSEEELKKVIVSETLNGRLENLGQTMYVKGDWTISDYWEEYGKNLITTIYVLSGATVTITGGNFNNHVVIYNYGTLKLNQQQCYQMKVYSSSTGVIELGDKVNYIKECEIKTEGNFSISNENLTLYQSNLYVGGKLDMENCGLTVQGRDVTVKGDLVAKSLNVKVSSQVYVAGKIDVEEIMDVNEAIVNAMKGIEANSFSSWSADIYMEDKIDVEGQITVGASDFTVAGAIEAEELNITNASKVYVGDKIDVEDDIYIENSSLTANGIIEAEDLSVLNSEIHAGCKIDVEEEISANTGSVIYGGYIEADEKITLKSEGDVTVVLSDGGYMKTKVLDITNTDKTNVSTNPGNTALVEAETIYGNDNNGTILYLKKTFTNLYIECNDWKCKGTSKDKSLDISLDISLEPELNTSVIRIKESEATSMKEVDTANECSPIIIHKPGEGGNTSGSGEEGGGNEGGDTPAGPVTPGTNEPDPVEPDPTGKLDFKPLASITPKDHDHPISATCIQFNGAGDKAYVSWHERGENIHGCIEVVGVDKGSNEVKLIAYAEDANNDYNHIFYDGEADRIITVGHNRKNAIIGQIALDYNGIFTNGTELNWTTLKGNRQPSKDDPEFYGGDGNCVIRNENFIQVASYGGLHTLNAEDFSRIGGEACTGAARTDGSCKHLSIDKETGKVAELHLTKRDKNMVSSPAELRWFSMNDHEWSEPGVIADDLVISPVDGKNTIALDGNYIYVCLGKGGVRKYDLNGNLIKEFKLDGKSLANGLAVDDNYLYIAYGGNGLRVLDKKTMAEKGFYRHKNGKSCNYVAVKGDLLYLAYGESGVDVVRMTEK